MFMDKLSFRMKYNMYEKRFVYLFSIIFFAVFLYINFISRIWQVSPLVYLVFVFVVISWTVYLLIRSIMLTSGYVSVHQKEDLYFGDFITICLLYYTTQYLVSWSVYFIAGLLAPKLILNNIISNIENLENLVTPISTFCSFFVAALVLLILPKLFAEKLIKSKGLFGFGFLLGEGSQLYKSFIYGLSVATVIVILNFLYFNYQLPFSNLSQISSMAYGPLYSQILCAVLVVLIVPVTEEYLFRGIILSELTKRIGIKWGIIISVLLFLIYHFTEKISFISIFGLIALSSITTYYRTITGCLGPSIVFHMSYNFTLLLSIFIVVYTSS